jgi:hypothetical protein
MPTTQVAKITLTPELDETLKRIQDTKNVVGLMLINKEGITVKTSLDSSVTALVQFLCFIIALLRYYCTSC